MHKESARSACTVRAVTATGQTPAAMPQNAPLSVWHASRFVTMARSRRIIRFIDNLEMDG
jgi:hypothetical protein